MERQRAKIDSPWQMLTSAKNEVWQASNKRLFGACVAQDYPTPIYYKAIYDPHYGLHDNPVHAFELPVLAQDMWVETKQQDLNPPSKLGVKEDYAGTLQFIPPEQNITDTHCKSYNNFLIQMIVGNKYRGSRSHPFSPRGMIS